MSRPANVLILAERLRRYMVKLKKKSNPNRLKKAQTILYMEPEQRDALKALSARTRVPQQVYLREGLDMVLARYKGEQ